MCKGNDFILIRLGLGGDFFLEHEFLSVFLNAHGSLLLYAHGFHGFFTRDFLNTNLTNNTNLFGMRIFLFFISTRISRISRIFLPTAVLDYGILGFLMRHKK